MKTSDFLNVLSRDELKDLLVKSDLKAFLILGFNWLLIIACFLAAHLSSNAFVWLIAAIILAGRQLGLAILMHDCAHDAFFKTKSFNRFFGKWLCAAPVLADLDRYRTYHLEHHRSAGSDVDPDRSNYISYPVSKASLQRKFMRDLFGVTGFKLFILVIKMNAGTVKYQLSYDGSMQEKVPVSKQIENVFINLWPSISIHTISAYFLGVTYFLFWIAWLSFYMVFSRLRNAAEHGATIDPHDLNPLLNTRTTIARPWERLTVAPNYVNFHLEHHLLPAIPSYNLERFHSYLRERGVLDKSKVSNGYTEVLRDLVKV